MIAFHEGFIGRPDWLSWLNITNLTDAVLPVTLVLRRQGETPISRVVNVSAGGDYEFGVHSELGFEPMFFRLEACADGAFSASLTMRRLADLVNGGVLTEPYEAKSTVIR